MLKAILIDDETHCLNELRTLLSQYCSDVQILAQFRSASAGLQGLKTSNPDLLFLDIEMPEMNGFELLEQFSTIPFAVIFTTGYDRYAVKAIRYSALDYLLKPVDPNELINAVKKVQGQKHLPTADQFQILLKQVQHKDHFFNKIAVPTLEGFEFVPAEEIVRCEADDNYTHLYLRNKSRIVACRTLKETEEQLHHFAYFVRVHNSHIVNLNEVLKYVRSEGGYLVMSDGATVNVSRSRKETLLSFF